MKERTGTVNCMIATIIICIIAELIGPLQFKVMGIDVKILTMIWVIIMGILLSPTLLGKVIPPLKKFISKAEIKRAPFLLSLTLYPLGIMFGINAGPKVGIVLQAGPALLFQEAGNMMTMLIALPLGLLLGLGRSAVGGTFSLCRDTALGIIGDKYNVKYLFSDFKKKDGYKKSIELSKKYNLYRQDYCGCLYGKNNRD